MSRFVLFFYLCALQSSYMHYYCKTASTLSSQKNSTDKNIAGLHVLARSKEEEEEAFYLRHLISLSF